MIKNQFILKKAHITMCLFVMFIISCSTKKESYKKVNSITTDSLQTYYNQLLEVTINALDSLNVNLQPLWYLKARKHFKLTEPILAFTDKDNYKSLNAPNILKIDEEDATNIKIKKPFGFQVIEELLYDDNIDSLYLKEVVTKTKNRLVLIKNNNKLYLKKYHVLWLVRDQIARTALTGISGFDSPVLEQSLQEASYVYKALNNIINIYKGSFKNTTILKQWKKELENAKVKLNSNFNSFDRFNFIKKNTHNQLKILAKIAEDWQVEYPLTLAFNNNITSLFSKETFNMDFFSDYHFSKENYQEKIALGKQLFNDTSLSKNKMMSCATCHDKMKAFTDGVKTFPKQIRNTPVLPYTAYQKAFFYDARAGSLEGQIIGVVENKNEFHTDMKQLIAKVLVDNTYEESFIKTYGEINDLNVRNAIAIYIRSLGNFNSKFDKNINKEEETLTASEINGFNLFMGKAKCATCHFPPVFNGTIPPNFKESELESIGVPLDSTEQELDTDFGRYNLFNTEERKHFFKTPTIRNIAKTSPYMHNGIYTNLKQVVNFYNKGGGEGIGYKVKGQTLPVDDLKLAPKEIDDIVSFMETLND